MRESQRILIEKKMAIGKFKRTHRGQDMKNISIEVPTSDVKGNHCFKFLDKTTNKEIGSICIKKY